MASHFATLSAVPPEALRVEPDDTGMFLLHEASDVKVELRYGGELCPAVAGDACVVLVTSK